MSEVVGLTEDLEYVSDEDEDEGDGGNGGNGGDGNGGHGGDQNAPISRDGSMVFAEYTDRHEYTIARTGGDPLGNPTTIEYKNGESIEFLYDNEGGLLAVVDTTSGTRLINTDQGWVRENANGERQPINGEVTVDKETGAVVTKLTNGMTVTANPDGRVVAMNADGTLAAVSLDRPDRMIEAQRSGSYRGFVDADYDENHNLISVTDQYGTRYQKDGEGWRMISGNTSVMISGTPEVSAYGVRVVSDSTVESEPIKGPGLDEPISPPGTHGPVAP